MSSPDKTTALPADEGFYDALVRHLFEFHADRAGKVAEAAFSADLSEILVLTPSATIGAEMRAVLKRASPTALLLPRFDSMKDWAFRAHRDEIPTPFPPSVRLVLLFEALRARDWFDETVRWEIASEIAALFDELNAHSIRLPENENSLTARLEEAYALKDSPLLAFEARIVYELWKTLNRSGVFDANLVYAMRLARIAQDAAKAGPPLFVVLDAAPEEALIPAERDFLRRYARLRPLRVFHPAPRETRATPLLRTLDTAWPQTLETPLLDRARALACELPQSPLAGRLRILPTEGREAEARAAAAQTCEWLRQGFSRIALIAQDRRTARRVRALLERRNILLKDETGWKLSTSRASATIDALLKTVSGNAAYRDVLDLLKSPYVFADIDGDERAVTVFALEAAIRRASIRSGLLNIRRCAAEIDSAENAIARALIDRVIQAASIVSAGRATISEWLLRLERALEILGARTPLDKDAAGRVLLALLEDRRAELCEDKALFSFGLWRVWLDREMESANFRDEAIESTVVLMPLKAAGLRPFDAALILGGDSMHLTASASGRFFNDAARRALGLCTREDEERTLRREIENVLTVIPRVAVTYRQDEESGPLAPDLARLASLNEFAWGDDLHGACLPPYPEPETDAMFSDSSAPSASPDLIPERVSVSACKALLACPYLFFARHVLGLGEMDEVREEMQKVDYGSFVHRILEIFHTRNPIVSKLSKDEARLALQSCADEVFDPAVSDDFLAIAWKQRWEKHVGAYLDWQRRRESEGWRWSRSEVKTGLALTLDKGRRIELVGRIDRVDRRAAGNAPKAAETALLDYKAQKSKSIKEAIEDDVQLALYALMYCEGADAHAAKQEGEGVSAPVDAAYVALDDDAIATIRSSDKESTLEEDAKSQGKRLLGIFNALHAGAKLPAHGVSRVCAYCEMGGLCRRDHA